MNIINQYMTVPLFKDNWKRKDKIYVETKNNSMFFATTISFSTAIFEYICWVFRNYIITMLFIKCKLEQLERLRSEDIPRRLMITHTIESWWIPSQNKVEWPWRYRSRSKVITCDTPPHASDHLFQIWKESIRNCRCYRADTIFKAKAKWPWNFRSRSKVIIRNTPSHHLC